MTVTRLAQLEGAWRLTRRIDDALQAEAGRLSGEAEFTYRDGLWHYTETGDLEFAGRPTLRASREYRYIEIDGGAEVQFANGAPFHVFYWQTASASHFCDPDTYEVNYDFSGWPNWSSEWTVSGPRKKYVMQSRYSRT